MFEIKDEFCAQITNPEKISYANQSMNKGYVEVIIDSKVTRAKIMKDKFWVQVLSMSPDDIHMVAYCHPMFEEITNSINPDRYHYYVLRKSSSSNSDEYEVVDYFVDPDDVCIQWFAQGFEWYPQYGFVKMIVKNVDTWEHRNKRIYFNRKLYERKKNKLIDSLVKVE